MCFDSGVFVQVGVYVDTDGEFTWGGHHLSREHLSVLSATRATYNNRISLLDALVASAVSSAYDPQRRLFVVFLFGNQEVSPLAQARVQRVNDDLARLTLASKIRVLRWLVSIMNLYELYIN
jgi:hypothetical protein